jgi:hypothetical protein
LQSAQTQGVLICGASDSGVLAGWGHLACIAAAVMLVFRVFFTMRSKALEQKHNKAIIFFRFTNNENIIIKNENYLQEIFSQG